MDTYEYELTVSLRDARDMWCRECKKFKQSGTALFIRDRKGEALLEFKCEDCLREQEIMEALAL